MSIPYQPNQPNPALASPIQYQEPDNKYYDNTNFPVMQPGSEKASTKARYERI